MSDETEGVWSIERGSVPRRHAEPGRDEVENLTYSNPFGLMSSFHATTNQTPFAQSRIA
jgi:hypothetical protein